MEFKFPILDTPTSLFVSVRFTCNTLNPLPQRALALVSYLLSQPLFAELGSKQHNLHNLYQVPSNLPERTLFAVWEKTATTRVLFLEGELGLGSAPIQLRNFNTIY